MECVILKVLQYFVGLCLLSTHLGWCESSLECWCSQVRSKSSYPRAQSSPEYFLWSISFFLRDEIFSFRPARTCVMASRLKTVGPTFSVWILNSDIHFSNHKSSWHPPYTVLRSCIHHFTLVLPDEKPTDIRRIPKIRHRIQLNVKLWNCLARNRVNSWSTQNWVHLILSHWDLYYVCK